MNKYTLTTKTYHQLAAEFATAFKHVMPADSPRPVSLAESLQPYRPHILKQRRRGLTWKQIADGMATPSIGVTVSYKLLNRLFGKDGVTKTGVPAAEASAGESPNTTRLDGSAVAANARSGTESPSPRGPAVAN